MPVKEPKNSDEFNKIIDQDDDHFVVVEFTTQSCGPCRFINPRFAKLSDEHEDVFFAKVDLDEIPDVSNRYAINALPTFILFSNGHNVQKIVGPNFSKVVQVVEQCSAMQSS